MQVKCASLSEFSQPKADVPRKAGKTVHCCCQREKQIRSVPGLSHVTYSRMPRGCQSSFLEISYSDRPINSQHDLQSQLRMEQLLLGPRRACVTVDKSELKGHVPLEQCCNKWPVHKSLTLVCDARPSHILVPHRTTDKTERLSTSVDRTCTAVDRSESKGHAPLDQCCNKWPVHKSFTLICDPRPCHIPVRHRTTEKMWLHDKNSSVVRCNGSVSVGGRIAMHAFDDDALHCNDNQQFTCNDGIVRPQM